MKQVGLLSPALLRALVAADEEWHRLIRELRHCKLIAAGEEFGPVMTLDDRREIGPETWLSEGLWFDVRTNAIYALNQNVGFGSRLIKLWDDIAVREAAGESEVEADQSSRQESSDAASSPESGQAKQNLRHEIVRTIIDGRHPNGYAGIREADLLREALSGFDAECKRRELDPELFGTPRVTRGVLRRALGLD